MGVGGGGGGVRVGKIPGCPLPLCDTLHDLTEIEDKLSAYFCPLLNHIKSLLNGVNLCLETFAEFETEADLN